MVIAVNALITISQAQVEQSSPIPCNMSGTSQMEQHYQFVRTDSNKKGREMIKIPYLLKQRPKKPNYPLNK